MDDRRNEPVRVPTYEEVLAAHREAGVLLVTHAMVLRALDDTRLKPRHRSILKWLAVAMMETGEACPPPDWLAVMTGLSVSTVNTTLSELRFFAYVETCRKAPDDEDRAVAHYLVRLSVVEQLRKDIAAAVAKLERRPRLAVVPSPSESDLTSTPPIEVRVEDRVEVRKLTSTPPVEVRVEVRNGEGSDFNPTRLSQAPEFNPVVEVSSKAATPTTTAVISSSSEDSPTEKELLSQKKLLLEQDATRTRAREVVGRTLLDPGVKLPALLQSHADRGTAPTAFANLVEAIDAAIARGVTPERIEADLRKSVADAIAETGDREPSPSRLFQKATRYVERSRNDEATPASPPAGQPQPAAPMGPSPNAPFARIGDLHLTWRDVYAVRDASGGHASLDRVVEELRREVGQPTGSVNSVMRWARNVARDPSILKQTRQRPMSA